MDLVREWLRAACDARVYDGVMCSIIKNEKEDQFYEERLCGLCGCVWLR